MKKWIGGVIVKRWIKRLTWLLAAGALLVGIVYTFLPKPVTVDMAQVDRGSLQVAVEEDGKTRLRDRYTVSSPLAGKLRRIRFKAGDVVPSGQPLAVIEPTDPELLDPRALSVAEARVKSAQASVQRAGTNMESAKAGLDLAEAEYARALELKERNAISKSEVEVKIMQQRTKVEEFRSSRYSEEIARFELELAQAALVRTRARSVDVDDNAQFEIPAPTFSGSGHTFHVLRVFQESETVVAPGTSLLELGDPADLEVEIDVLSSDAIKIRPGARVILEQWGGEAPLEARVRLVEPSGFTKISALGVEEQRVNVIADFPNRDDVPSNLGDGYRVEAKIVVWESGDVLRVPTSALFRLGEGWAVFRVIEGRVQRCPVEIGRRNGLYAEVLNGLAASDRVVVHPSDKVIDGVMVVPR